jgi:hypothetical protein
MARVSVAEVQAWLDPEKLQLPSNDPLPEEQHSSNIVLSKLAQVFDVSDWVDEATTPSLVRTIISGLTAARRYNKIYSETEDAGNKYANKLEAILMDMINQVVAGSLTLTDVETGDSPAQVHANNPKFWPNDRTGALEVHDARGMLIQPEGSQDIKFRMGQTW